MCTSTNERECRIGPAIAKLPAVTIALLICGCGVGPRYVPPTPPTAPAYKELAKPANSATQTWQPAVPGDTANGTKWWLAFNDPELNKLEERAVSANWQVIAAADNFTAARALVRQARAQYFPVLTANPAVVRSLPSSAQFGALQNSNSAGGGISIHTYNDFSLPFDASWEPDFWGRIRNGVRISSYGAQASAADLANVRLCVEAELAVDYFEIRAQDHLKRLADSAVAAEQAEVDLSRSEYKAGLVSDEVVAQMEAQLQSTQVQDSNLEILRDQYEHAIAVLLGQSPSSISLPINFGDTDAPEIPVGIPSELIQRRPDIASAERSMAQANAQIGVAKAAYFPAVLLSADGGFGGSSVSQWISWPSRFWSVGAAATQTVFDAGLRRATVQQYRATYDATVANYQQTVLTAFQQVEDNLAALRILKEEIERQSAATEASRREFAEAAVRYKAGLDPYQNVIGAQLALLNNEQSLVTIREQRMIAAVQLIKALGGGWDVAVLPSTRQLQVTGSAGASPSAGQ